MTRTGWDKFAYFFKISQLPISWTIFLLEFKFNGNLELVWLHSRVSYNYKILHMPQQHSCCVMCKISYYKLDGIRMKFALNKNFDGKKIHEMGLKPTSYHNISWCLKPARFRFRILQLLRDMTCVSAPLLLSSLSNLKSIYDLNFQYHSSDSAEIFLQQALSLCEYSPWSMPDYFWLQKEIWHQRSISQRLFEFITQMLLLDKTDYPFFGWSYNFFFFYEATILHILWQHISRHIIAIQKSSEKIYTVKSLI